jgi:hypothetical protein
MLVVCAREVIPAAVMCGKQADAAGEGDGLMRGFNMAGTSQCKGDPSRKELDLLRMPLATPATGTLFGARKQAVRLSSDWRAACAMFPGPQCCHGASSVPDGS